MEHQLSIGADYSHTVFKSTDLAGLVFSIDLYDPTYDAINKPEIIFTVYDHSSRQQFDSWGIFELLARAVRSEAHTSALQSLMPISHAVFCLTQTKHPSTFFFYTAPSQHPLI